MLTIGSDVHSLVRIMTHLRMYMYVCVHIHTYINTYVYIYIYVRPMIDLLLETNFKIL